MRAVDLLLSFRTRAISPCPPREPIASCRLIYSHAFVTVTRLRDRSRATFPSRVSLVRVVCVSLSLSLLFAFSFHSLFSPVCREKERVCSVPLFFFSRGRPSSSSSSRARARAGRTGAVAPTIFAISRRAIFPARGAFRA